MKTLKQFLEGRLDSQDYDYARTGGKTKDSNKPIIKGHQEYFTVDGKIITIINKDKLLFNIDPLFKVVAGKKIKIDDGAVRVVMNDTMLKNVVSSGAKVLTIQ
jgi:predicted ribosome-associated RNA-binding protein Tma20